uniref:CSD domain-containing protein n=1 Tax=Alexandrium catenella TaxID=2925 RepID=A0A7S1L8Q2_ALECA
MVKDWCRGVVKTWHGSKHFGFIQQSDGTDIFAHQSGLVCEEEPRQGMPVCYLLDFDEKKGKHSAINVMEEILDLAAPQAEELARRGRERRERREQRERERNDDRRSPEDHGDRQNRRGQGDEGDQSDQKTWQQSEQGRWNRQTSWGQDQQSWQGGQDYWKRSDTNSWAEGSWTEGQGNWSAEQKGAAPDTGAGTNGHGAAETTASGYENRAAPY